MLLVLLLVLPLLGGVVIGVAPRHPLAGWAAVVTNGAVLVARRAAGRPGGRAHADARRVGDTPCRRAERLHGDGDRRGGRPGHLARDPHAGLRPARCARATRGRATGYGVLVQAFIATMLLAVLAANLGVLWVAVEATTIVTTFLVGHRRTKGALEASWKYLVICSVGIALAFFGTVLVYLAALHVGGHSAHALDWTSLMANAHRMDPSVMRLAFALLVLGYGTKVGLAPMHSWLPDAHSQAPAPVSALMSGVLLTVAFYAILRFKSVVDLAVGPAFPRTLLVIVGLLSLAVAASLLIAQRDYKRMLAYSSIEHMGLIALGAAAGIRLAIAAVLLQILGHGLTKTVLFLTSGEILAAEGTSQIDAVRSLLARRPALGGIFGFGLVALLGLPPFSLFSSELLMTRAEFQVGLGWVAVVAVGLMVVIFVAVVGHARHMLLGPSSNEQVASAPPRWVTAPLVGGLVVCAIIGVAAPGHWTGSCRLPPGWWRREQPRCPELHVPGSSRAGWLQPEFGHGVAGRACRSGLGAVRTMACGWHWCPGTTTAWQCASCTSSRRGHLTFGSRFRSPSTASQPEVPTLSALSFPASRFERELRDLFGIEPIDHPQPRRLVLHQHWPDDWFPMRRDAGPPPSMAASAEQFPFVPVTGTGVYEIPVGPVHAGLIEPGHFRFWVVGETILRMKARLWFVHKGIERLFEGKHVMDGVDIAERISGDTAVGHTIAFCQAVEDARQVVVPEHGQILRGVLLELERVYNHVADIGALCNDVGFGLAQAWALSLREDLLQLNHAVTGHRLLRGGVVPGGAHVQRLPTHDELDRVGHRFEELVTLASSNAFVMERFTGTATLDASHARDLGLVGPTARASGVAFDARTAHPFVGSC